MKKRTRVLAMLLSMALLVGAAAGCGSKNETEQTKDSQTTEETKGNEGESKPYVAEKTPLRLGRHSSGSLLVYLAEAAGYFDDENLDVEFVRSSGSADGIAAVMAGHIDISVDYGCAYPMKFITEGADLTLFAGNISGGYVVIGNADVFPEGSYKDIGDLEGHTVMMTRGYTGAIMQEYAMFKAGLREGENWTLVPASGDSWAAVSSGKVDAAQNGWRNVVRAQQSGDKSVRVLDWTNDLYDSVHVCCRMVAMTDFVEQNPEVIKGFIRAILRAEKLRYDDPQFAKDVIVNDLEWGKEEADYYIDEEPQLNLAEPDSDAILEMFDACDEMGFLEKGNIDLTEYINIELYKEVLDDLCEENPDDDYYKKLQTRYEESNTTMLKKGK